MEWHGADLRPRAYKAGPASAVRGAGGTAMRVRGGADVSARDAHWFISERRKCNGKVDDVSQLRAERGSLAHVPGTPARIEACVVGCRSGGEHVFVMVRWRADGTVNVAIRLALEPEKYAGAVVHLRIVAPQDQSSSVLELLEGDSAVTNVVLIADAARKPAGDLILCDIAREQASVVVDELRALRLAQAGSITIEPIETQLSRGAADAERAAAGAPGDAVIWEEVTARTSDSATLTFTFALFMALSTLITAVGIFLDSPILIVGGMVVGPEFGPIAGFCVAAVSRHRDLAMRSAAALAVGFPLAIAASLAASLLFKWTGVTPDTFTEADHSFAEQISNPDFLSFFIAVCAGTAGVLSLSTAKSGALIGVVISVTTIPAAANVGLATAYGDTDAALGSLAQLAINVTGILLAGVITLSIQRYFFRRRRDRARHLGARRPVA